MEIDLKSCEVVLTKSLDLIAEGKRVDSNCPLRAMVKVNKRTIEFACVCDLLKTTASGDYDESSADALVDLLTKSAGETSLLLINKPGFEKGFLRLPSDVGFLPLRRCSTFHNMKDFPVVKVDGSGRVHFLLESAVNRNALVPEHMDRDVVYSEFLYAINKLVIEQAAALQSSRESTGEGPSSSPPCWTLVTTSGDRAHAEATVRRHLLSHRLEGAVDEPPYALTRTTKWWSAGLTGPVELSGVALASVGKGSDKERVRLTAFGLRVPRSVAASATVRTSDQAEAVRAVAGWAKQLGNISSSLKDALHVVGSGTVTAVFNPFLAQADATATAVRNASTISNEVFSSDDEPGSDSDDGELSMDNPLVINSTRRSFERRRRAGSSSSSSSSELCDNRSKHKHKHNDSHVTQHSPAPFDTGEMAKIIARQFLKV